MSLFGQREQSLARHGIPEADVFLVPIAQDADAGERPPILAEDEPLDPPGGRLPPRSELPPRLRIPDDHPVVFAGGQPPAVRAVRDVVTDHTATADRGAELPPGGGTQK